MNNNRPIIHEITLHNITESGDTRLRTGSNEVVIIGGKDTKTRAAIFGALELIFTGHTDSPMLKDTMPDASVTVTIYNKDAKEYSKQFTDITRRPDKDGNAPDLFVNHSDEPYTYGTDPFIDKLISETANNYTVIRYLDSRTTLTTNRRKALEKMLGADKFTERIDKTDRYIQATEDIIHTLSNCIYTAQNLNVPESSTASEQYALDKHNRIKDALMKIKKAESDAKAQHIRKVIKDTALPFYIYSARVIPSCTGLTLRYDETNDIIRITTLKNPDTDITDKMPADYFAALGTAFILSANKCYADYDTDSLNFLALDGIIQPSEDSMAAWALTETLRREFNKHNIIMSESVTGNASLTRFRLGRGGIKAQYFDESDIEHES